MAPAQGLDILRMVFEVSANSEIVQVAGYNNLPLRHSQPVPLAVEIVLYVSLRIQYIYPLVPMLSVYYTTPLLHTLPYHMFFSVAHSAVSPAKLLPLADASIGQHNAPTLRLYSTLSRSRYGLS